MSKTFSALPQSYPAMPKPTVAEMNELRRKAYHWGELDTVRLIEQSGIPADLCPLNIAARIAGCTRAWLNKRRRDGSIRTYRVGSRILVPLSDLIKRQELGGKGSNRIAKVPQPVDSPAVQGTRAR